MMLVSVARTYKYERGHPNILDDDTSFWFFYLQIFVRRCQNAYVFVLFLQSGPTDLLSYDWMSPKTCKILAYELGNPLNFTDVQVRTKANNNERNL
eukprot:scaffold103139_cov48-Attheya_sp.AAC.2